MACIIPVLLLGGCQCLRTEKSRLSVIVWRPLSNVVMPRLTCSEELVSIKMCLLRPLHVSRAGRVRLHQKEKYQMDGQRCDVLWPSQRFINACTILCNLCFTLTGDHLTTCCHKAAPAHSLRRPVRELSPCAALSRTTSTFLVSRWSLPVVNGRNSQRCDHRGALAKLWPPSVWNRGDVCSVSLGQPNVLAGLLVCSLQLLLLYTVLTSVAFFGELVNVSPHRHHIW